MRKISGEVFIEKNLARGICRVKIHNFPGGSVNFTLPKFKV